MIGRKTNRRKMLELLILLIKREKGQSNYIVRNLILTSGSQRTNKIYIENNNRNMSLRKNNNLKLTVACACVLTRARDGDIISDGHAPIRQ